MYESVKYINAASVVLIILFDSIIAYRVQKDIFTAMHDEDFPIKKRLTNSLKAIAVVNGIPALVMIIKHFYY